MTGYLAHVLARGRPEAPLLRPRPRSRFEQVAPPAAVPFAHASTRPAPTGQAAAGTSTPKTMRDTDIPEPGAIDFQPADARHRDPQRPDPQRPDFQHTDFQHTEFQHTEFQRPDLQHTDLRHRGVQDADPLHSDSDTARPARPEWAVDQPSTPDVVRHDPGIDEAAWSSRPVRFRRRTSCRRNEPRPREPRGKGAQWAMSAHRCWCRPCTMSRALRPRPETASRPGRRSRPPYQIILCRIPLPRRRRAGRTSRPWTACWSPPARPVLLSGRSAALRALAVIREGRDGGDHRLARAAEPPDDVAARLSRGPESCGTLSLASTVTAAASTLADSAEPLDMDAGERPVTTSRRVRGVATAPDRASRTAVTAPPADPTPTPPPAVHVTIGRVEVRPPPPPLPSAPPAASPPGLQPLSLDEYLRQRDGSPDRRGWGS